MNGFGIFVILNLVISIFAFALNILYFSLKENNKEKSDLIDKHISKKNEEFKQVEDNDLIIIKDDSFNKIFLMIIMSLIPLFNILLVYYYINGIIFIKRKRNDKKNK